MLKRVGHLVVVLAFFAAPLPAAVADVVCAQRDANGVCILTTDTGYDGGASGAGGASGGSAAYCPTLVPNRQVLCQLPDGAWWNRANSCYVRIADPQPPADQLDQWGKPLGLHPGEKAFWCYAAPSGGSGGSYPIIWLPVAPAVDPLVLARQAISQMNLSAITVGIVPDPLPGRVGIIGMPTWMWAEGPSENTTGPITRSASSAGNVVTATATVKRIVWDMGDGHTVTCTGPGTRYEDRYGKTNSPTCGYTYTRQGDFTVTATSYWEVAWNGMGQSGVIPLTFSRSASITMGEIQVLRR